MEPAPLRFETLCGDALRAWLPRLAGLRIAVFRDWPYLYDGDAAYEERYLASYADSPGAAVIAALDGERTVGCATCQPMPEAETPVREAFLKHGEDLARWCYFGESVLLPEYRGRGAGVRFFDLRESHARTLGLTATAFCAVARDDDDPRRPHDYVRLDSFWRNRGYVPRADISLVFDWREVGSDRKTPHTLGFWAKERL
ncbi:GNAT family N-acetyltransferase [Roseomonas terrae]|jgi:GNAT superfamily N-acetyltransferase|uniref:GNAT family N-acetyltransferase n=1 Tax=Neoroseomonas terrae TaxID=424799 RepID=A0ABS5EED1_9PROT|nr:GNAT family N-acetyltransferase [Neoroseomonas terrae]MBR0649373.1 GNAT family N-acetyltransferase [Neoroseomonas terrae]